MVPDYYARLGVDPGADRADIEAALKRLAASLVDGDKESEDPPLQPALPR